MSDTATRLESILIDVGRSMEGLDPSTTLDQMGIDSLELLDMVMEIDEEFDITLPIDEWLDEIDADPSRRGAVLSLGNIIATIDRLRQ